MGEVPLRAPGWKVVSDAMGTTPGYAGPEAVLIGGMVDPALVMLVRCWDTSEKAPSLGWGPDVFDRDLLQPWFSSGESE